MNEPVRAIADHHPTELLFPAELLIAGGCHSCDWRCALPEGGNWPLCPGCGEQTWPWRRDVQGWEEQAEAGVGYLAFRLNEMDIVRFLNSQMKLDGPSPEQKPTPGRFGTEHPLTTS